ncbi:MAG: hypothetical protein QGH40_16680, partial [bacterium]|nr:hypothetical protein [bacterium]
MSAERKVSQNEIDALFASTLGGEAISNDEGGDSPPPAGSSSAGTETTGSGISNLNKILVPVLQEKLSAAARRGVSFNAPSFNSIGQAECLEEHKDTTYLKARVTFSGSLSGQIILLFTKREALTIADLVAGRFDGSEIPEEADDIHLDAFNDVLNEVKPSLADSFGGLIGGQVDVDFSRAEMGMLDGTADELPDPLVEIRYPVSVEDVVEGRVVAIVSDDFLSLLEGGSGTDEGDGSSDASSDASSDTSSDSSGDDLDLSGPFGDMLLGGGGDEEEPPSGGDAGEVDDDLQSLLQQFAESSGGEEAPQPAMPFGAPEAPAAGGFQQPVSVKPVEFSPLTP